LGLRYFVPATEPAQIGLLFNKLAKLEVLLGLNARVLVFMAQLDRFAKTSGGRREIARFALCQPDVIQSFAKKCRIIKPPGEGEHEFAIRDGMRGVVRVNLRFAEVAMTHHPTKEDVRFREGGIRTAIVHRSEF
jgi:hypothetical protein